MFILLFITKVSREGSRGDCFSNVHGCGVVLERGGGGVLGGEGGGKG